MSGEAKVKTIAIPIPTAAIQLPERAVGGEESRLIPTIRQDRRDEVHEVDRRLREREEERHSDVGLGRLALEHLEHAVGDEEAADDVDRPEDDGDERERLLEVGVGRAGDRASPRRGRCRGSRSSPTSAACAAASGRFEMISMPMNTARTKTVMLLSSVMVTRRIGSFSTRPSWVTHVSRVISSSKSSVSSEPPPRRWFRNVHDVARVHLARVQRHRAREVELADDGDAALDDGLARLR